MAPSLDNSKWVQKTIKNTDQLIPEIIAKILAKVAKRKWRIREDMQTVRNAFNPDFIALIAGAVPTELRFNHVARIEAQDSKNKDILRGIQNLNDFEAGLAPDATWFHKGRVWVNHRVGLQENLINPQTDKFQRHNITMEAWRTTVDPTVQGPVQDRFILAVAQGMGISTDKVLDKESAEALGFN